MNKIKIFQTRCWIAGGLVVLLASASCTKKFLTKNPDDSLSLGQALGSVSDMETALNGLYQQLRATQLWDRDIPVIGDLQADNTFIESNNSNRYVPQFQFTFPSTDAVELDIWQYAYQGITYANLIIDANVTGADDIKAQAFALRGLLYFKLITMYARPYTDTPNGPGVPLILHYNPNLLPGRDSISKVYNQIVTDLTTAFNTAPDYANSVEISKYAIEGLLARTYLYMGDNTNAKARALDVINNSGFTLAQTASDYANFWKNPGIKSDKLEVMYEVDADDVNNNGTNDLGAIFYGGYSDIYASQQLVSLYSATDVRRSVLYDSSTKSHSPATMVLKYPNAKSTDKDNPKVIRLAEVYLIAAEASLPGNEGDALKYLNALMAVRDPAFTGYTSTGSQLLDDIVTERRKELAFEGDRFYDLNRLKRDINRGTPNAGSSNPMVNTIPYSDTRRISPIPKVETQANATIAAQQNPGYN